MPSGGFVGRFDEEAVATSFANRERLGACAAHDEERLVAVGIDQRDARDAAELIVYTVVSGGELQRLAEKIAAAAELHGGCAPAFANGDKIALLVAPEPAGGCVSGAEAVGDKANDEQRQQTKQQDFGGH